MSETDATSRHTTHDHTASDHSAHATIELARAMSEVARHLQGLPTVDEAWATITALAVERLDGVEHAGITVVRRGRPTTPASSDDLPPRVDQAQYETGQGPCLDALHAHVVFTSQELGAETERWPDFAPRAAELGVRSMLSYQLFVEDTTLGALNFYSTRPAAFDDAVQGAGSVFAAHAALALAAVQEHEKVVHLERALDTNRMIGAACGILMAQHRLTEQQAFDVLRTFSQHNNRKLREVADDVVHIGAMPQGRRR